MVRWSALVLVALISSAVQAQYVVDFEGAGETDTGYAASTVNLSGLNWSIGPQALIGTDANDMKNGSRAARLRVSSSTYGSISMTQDKADGLGSISFYYARSNFANDRSTGPPSFVVEYSTNGGSSWSQIGSVTSLSGVDTLTLFSETVNVSGNVRVRIRQTAGTSGRRWNVDDITLTDYVPATDQPPSLGPLDITGVGSTTATFASEVTDEGGQPVTARGFVYSLTATNGDPAIGGTGVTLVSSGDGDGPFIQTVTTLLAGAEYSVAAYATNAIGITYSDVVTFTTDCFGAPTGLTATDISFDGFTAQWDPVSGASGYRLDVGTNDLFGAGGGSEGFESGLPTSYGPETEFELASGIWTGSPNQVIRGTEGVQSGSYSLQLRAETGSHIVTPTLLGGVANVSFYVTSSTSSGSLQVNVSSDDGDTWTAAPGSPFTGLGTTTTLISIDVDDPDINRIEFRRTAATIRIDDVVWTPMLGDGFIPAYSNLFVSGTSQLVDGLEPETTYYFRVRAENDHCISGNSSTQLVTTSAIPLPQIDTNTITDITNPSRQRSIFVYTNSASAFAGEATDFSSNRPFRVTDAWLANLDSSNDIQVHFGAWDPVVGLARTNSPPTGEENAFTRMTIGNWFVDNHSFFDYDLSSPDPVDSKDNATNVWRITSAPDGDTINGLMVDSNRISVTIMNTAGFGLEDQQFGWLSVVDDDIEPPQIGEEALTIMLDGVVLPTIDVDELVAGWNFNSDDTSVSHGHGTLLNHLPGTLNYFGGTTLNAIEGDTDGNAFSPTGLGNNDESFEFELDLSGLHDLVLTYATRGTSEGYSNHQWSWSTDGLSYTIFSNVPANQTATWSLSEVDFSGVSEIENQPQVFVRITLSGATAAQGNNRFDNFQFNATRMVYQITDAQLRSVGAGTPLDFSINIYDVGSGIYRGTSSFGGTNMQVTIEGIATNNTANFHEDSSATETFAPSSTSVWRFVSGFSREAVGDLYGDGTNYLSVSITASDRDNDRPNDNLWISDRLVGTFMVIDDDPDPPEVEDVNFSGANARPFMVLLDGAPSASGAKIRGTTVDRREGSGSNTTFRLSDADLAAANAGTLDLAFVFGAVDAGSGIARRTTGDTNTVMSISIGDVVVGNFTNYNAALSSALAGPGQVTTNYWTFPVGFFDDARINAWMDAGEMKVTVTIPDTDDDRPGDRSLLVSHQVGYLEVVDDDIRGPIIASAEIVGTDVASGILFTSFESAEGWPSSAVGSGTMWTNVVAGRSWIGRGVTQTAFLPVFGGSRRVGLLVDDFSDPWLQLPPFDHPGLVQVNAGRFSGSDVNMRLEHWTGSEWVSLGNRLVTNTSPSYALYSWDADISGTGVVLRIARDATGPQIYMDDLSVIPLAQWISTNQLNIVWTEAVDDFHGVDEYRLVEPAENTEFPTAKTNGVYVAASETSIQVNIEGEQGVLTGYIFAIDDDNDRAFDRAMGNIVKLVARVDTNPPMAITSGWDVAEDLSLDDTSEARLEWTPPGGSEEEGAGWRQSDSAPLSPWRTYRIYYTDEPTGPDFDDLYIDYTVNPELAHYVTDEVVVSNFVFGTEYRFAIAGVDEAGNVGPLSDPLTHLFAGFSVTQGVAVANTESRLYWEAQTGRTYDLIYADGDAYSSALNSQFQLAATGETNALNHVVSAENGTMRFYRAAPRGRWSNENRRVASEEVYVAKNIELRAGQNWVGFPGVPDSNTVSAVFGTDLPRGGTYPLATQIHWYERGNTENTTQTVWLATSGDWLDLGSQVVNDKPVDLSQGVVMQVPEDTSFLFVGRVPTNTLSQTIAAEQGRQPVNRRFNLVSFRVPRPMHPSEMNLVNSGFTGGTGFARSDRIWKLNRATQEAEDQIWYHTDGTWRFPNGTIIPASYRFTPDDAMVIYTVASNADWEWELNPADLYALPTRLLD